MSNFILYIALVFILIKSNAVLVIDVIDAVRFPQQTEYLHDTEAAIRGVV